MHGSGQASDRFVWPARVDELVGKLKITDTDVGCHRADQIIRFGKPIHKRVGVE
ncbi:hypothetical protein SPICUR_04400 [Spiribacter curvatus]|uniref:Uncharacterized protein n=1 Tax=Spiribacter curvatus TaxID=1335757 RepID=U5T341_9GAMM|nr:hypothetical protein SPICUR_04400 [Spiribacter curvatus]